jgi:hypothetical protein
MPLMEQQITLLVSQIHGLIKYNYIEIFFEALEKKYYKCWLAPKTDLPMIYIDDCVRGTVI